VQWRGSALVRLVKVLNVLLMLVGLGFGLMRHDWMVAMRVGVGIPLLLLMLVWTMVVTPALALMNTPANARLVPRMRKRMVELTAAGWLLSGAFGLLTPFWQATPLIVLWVMSMSGARAGNRVGTVLVIFAAMSGSVLDRLPASAREFCMSAPGILIFCLLVAAYGAWSIRTVLPNGGDRHFAKRKRQVEIIERLQSMGRKPSKADGKPIANPYTFVLRRAINARQSSSLMLLGFGPGAHWTAMLPLCAMILVGGFGLHPLFGLKGSADSSVAGWILLRLAPGLPNGRKWNRSFGAALVRNGLAVSMLTVLTTVALALLDGAGQFELISLTALSATLVMPGIAWMLRDYSREHKQRPVSSFGKLVRVVPAALALLVGLVAMLGLQISIGAMAWVLLAAASNVLGALTALWRWRTMISAPPAFAS
jgi:hypothetical protein